jgi:alginate O-acetyltransferase complex protein AlgJ
MQLIASAFLFEFIVELHMKIANLRARYILSLLAFFIGISSVHSAEPSLGIIGKNEWLFYRYEILDANEKPSIDTSLDLIRRLDKILNANGTKMVVAIVPLKMRIYADFLPEDIKLSPDLSQNYDRLIAYLRSANVKTVDLNASFQSSIKKSNDSALFYKLDTHWSPAGAMLAAETLKLEFDSNEALKNTLNAVPEEAYNLFQGNRKRPFKGGNLVGQLPKNTINFSNEQILPVSVNRVKPLKLNADNPIGLSLVGSTYSHDWTGFSDSLRFTFQRDIYVTAAGSDQGPWTAMETYLRSDVFQTQNPKLLIWEIPEREMRGPPDYKFRGARYIGDNTEWLARVAALAQPNCVPSSATPKILPSSSIPVNVKSGDVTVGVTSETDYIDVSFNKLLTKTDYFDAKIMASGSKSILIEGSGSGVTARKFNLTIPGDSISRYLKLPLPSNGGGYSKVRIFPGKTDGFSLQALQVCRLSEDVFKK